MSAEAKTSIYQLKITLEYIRPPIWRRIYVADDTILLKLHRILQKVMGWRNCHLHAFQVKGYSYGPKDPYMDDHRDEKKYTLRDIAKGAGSRFRYQYDFGCDWMHEIVVEKIVELPADVQIPSCVEGKRACPPEDVDAVGGYDNFLEAIADPDHPEHDELTKWIGREFHSEVFDVDAVNAALGKLDDSNLEESDFF